MPWLKNQFIMFTQMFVATCSYPETKALYFILFKTPSINKGEYIVKCE